MEIPEEIDAENNDLKNEAKVFDLNVIDEEIEEKIDEQNV